eukprot:scaffold33196_cov73-Phaeocystis_antarctica.AAC.3
MIISCHSSGRWMKSSGEQTTECVRAYMVVMKPPISLRRAWQVCSVRSPQNYTYCHHHRMDHQRNV